MIPSKFQLKLSVTAPFKGKKHHFSHGIIITAPSDSLQWNIKITKRVVPLAVDRNRLRRQIIQGIYRHKDELPTLQFLIILQRSPATDQVEPIIQEIITKAKTLHV